LRKTDLEILISIIIIENDH